MQSMMSFTLDMESDYQGLLRMATRTFQADGAAFGEVRWSSGTLDVEQQRGLYVGWHNTGRIGQLCIQAPHKNIRNI
jgi:hypothetical protein